MKTLKKCCEIQKHEAMIKAFDHILNYECKSQFPASLRNYIEKLKREQILKLNELNGAISGG